MTWGNRFKLFFGTILVTVAVAAATVLWNHRQTEVHSISASVIAENYGVGTDYAGLVITRFVEEGDFVEEGEAMFEVESLALQRDIEIGAVDTSNDDISKKGVLTVRAGVSGTVSEVVLDVGAFAPAGAVLATVDREDSLTAEAQFVLTPRDFGRVEEGSTVELMLPDQRVLRGKVTDMNVDTVDGEALVTATVSSAELVDDPDDPLLRDGTPVEATLRLRDDGPLADVTVALRDFVHRLGL